MFNYSVILFNIYIVNTTFLKSKSYITTLDVINAIICSLGKFIRLDKSIYCELSFNNYFNLSKGSIFIILQFYK